MGAEAVMALLTTEFLESGCVWCVLCTILRINTAQQMNY